MAFLPHLKFHFLPVHLNSLNFEVDAWETRVDKREDREREERVKYSHIAQYTCHLHSDIHSYCDGGPPQWTPIHKLEFCWRQTDRETDRGGRGLSCAKLCMPESQPFFWERRDGKRDRNEGGWTFREPSEGNEIWGRVEERVREEAARTSNKKQRENKNERAQTSWDMKAARVWETSLFKARKTGSLNVAAWFMTLLHYSRTDGGNVCRVEIVLSETNDQTCFAHSAVSDE